MKPEYIYVAFDSLKEPLLYDTNTDFLDEARLEKADKVLKFKIEPSSLTDKFISLLEDFFELNKKAGQGDKFGYTYYMTRGAENTLEVKHELNHIIQKINNLGLYKIDPSLAVDPDSQKAESHKLNELHYIFESQSVVPEFKNEVKFQNLLWKLNNAIHTIENFQAKGLDRIYPKWFMTYFFHCNKEIELAPDDYAGFEMELPYTLYLDLNSAGKTLIECYWNDDLELIKRGTVRQQTTISTGLYLSMIDYIRQQGWKSLPEQKKMAENANRENYDRWLNVNKVGDYLDLSDPRYTPGRHCLARLVDPDPEKLDWIKEWDKNYSLAGIYLNE